MPSTAIVVIPVHRSLPGPIGQVALRHIALHLGDMPVALLAPEGLDLSAYREALPRAAVERADPRHFRSLAAYNSWMTQADPYHRFRDFEFMLCHQLDAAVFDRDLAAWCRAGYDYLGAPWMKRTNGSVFCAGVGNGGFSLRRIPSFLRVLRAAARPWARWAGRVDEWLQILPQLALDARVSHEALVGLVDRIDRADPALARRRLHWALRQGPAAFLRRFRRHEDYFWSFAAPLLDPEFRVAPPDVAMRFAVETEPAYCLEHLGGRLPFGCHAWARYAPDLWSPHLVTAAEAHSSAKAQQATRPPAAPP